MGTFKSIPRYLELEEEDPRILQVGIGIGIRERWESDK